MIVFKTKYRPTPRGIKIISKKDRNLLIDVLEKLCYDKARLSLKEILVEIMERDFANSKALSNEYMYDNIEYYMKGEAGIGLNLLSKIADRVGFTCVFQVKFPSKESTLMIE